MRNSARAGLTLVALLAVGVVLAPTAGAAAPTTSGCSATALVRPLLGGPSCTTLPQVCPAGATCQATVKLNAKQLIGLGRTTAKYTVYDVDHPEVNIEDSCSGANQCNLVQPDISVFPQGENLRYAARCEWTGNTLGVLAQIGCTLTQDSVDVLPG